MNTTPEDGVRRTLADYANCHDRRDAAGYAALFAEEGSFTGANNAPFVGRAAVLAFISQHYASQPADRSTKHLCANPWVDVDADGSTARARTDFIAYERSGASPWVVHTIGQYQDRLRLDDGVWRFVERRVESVGVRH